MMKRLLALAMFCACNAAVGATALEFSQNLGAMLPLRATFTDAQGHATQLGEYFGKTPVVMVFGYYHCPQLCSTVMDGVLQAIQDAGLPYAVVGIGIDPRETPADAASKLKAYRSADDNAAKLHLLTGRQDQIERVARTAGFQYEYDQPSDQFTHPAGFLVATPAGRISRYFSGLRFDRRDVRLALIEASDERVGSLAEQVLLLCSHYDPLAGRYTFAAMTLARIVGLLTILLLAAGIWRAHRRSATRPGARRPGSQELHAQSRARRPS